MTTTSTTTVKIYPGKFSAKLTETSTELACTYNFAVGRRRIPKLYRETDSRDLFDEGGRKMMKWPENYWRRCDEVKQYYYEDSPFQPYVISLVYDLISLNESEFRNFTFLNGKTLILIIKITFTQ